MTDDFENDPIARELRASLERHAREAPRGDLLAERIIRTSEPDARRTPRSWRTWSLPLIAAGAVAGVVAIVAGIQDFQSTASRPVVQPGNSGSASVLQSAVPAASTSPTATSSTGGSPTSTPASATSVPVRHIKVADLTFAYGEGWALASAECLHGSGRCSALLHQKGAKWWSVPSTPFNVPGVTGGCADPCVTNLRFADPTTGYAFGPSALFLTTDGGRHWSRQPGGALALETLDGNVVRVTASSASGCPGPCGVQVETSSIGGTTWTASDLPAVSGESVSLARGGSDAYLLVQQHQAGGAASAQSTLYRSADDGRHWHSSGEPCPQSRVEADSVAVTGAPSGRVTVLCARRQAPQLERDFVITSTDGGVTFGSAGANVPLTGIGLLTGDPATELVVTGDSGLVRSTDRGVTWHAVPGVDGPVEFVGFESQDVGRAVSSDGRTIWTTHDAGKTWQPLTLA